jgi:hypothetical protein
VDAEEQCHKAEDFVQNSEESFREAEASASQAEASARLNCAPAARQLREEIRAGPPMARARIFLRNPTIGYFVGFYRTFQLTGGPGMTSFRRPARMLNGYSSVMANHSLGLF